MSDPLRILLVEDEALVLMQLESLLEDEGHIVVGTAMSSREAMEIAAEVEADLALVDVHLADGPTGVEVARHITERNGTAVVFMTANPRRIPDDFAGAIGVIGKPYTQDILHVVLGYLDGAVRRPPPSRALPRSLTLALAYARRWSASPGMS